MRARPRFILAVLFVFVGFTSAQVADPEQHLAWRVPFQSINGNIFLNAWINGKPAVFMLDTGSNFTAISTAIVGSKMNLEPARPNSGGAGIAFIGTHLSVNLAIKSMVWTDRVVVMSLKELQRQVGVKFDGPLGEDILRQFSAVRIDYKNQVVEFEQ